jgi:hypothetical protein
MSELGLELSEPYPLKSQRLIARAVWALEDIQQELARLGPTVAGAP